MIYTILSSAPSGLAYFTASAAFVDLLRRLCNFQNKASQYPSILYHSDSRVASIVEKVQEELFSYSNNWLLGLLDPNGELQTAYMLFSRKVLMNKKPEYDREIFNLVDGGCVGLDWIRDEGRDDISKPLVILMHGLAGHTRSQHLVGCAKTLKEQGFYVVSFVARGCGGVPLTTPETFTAARTSDYRAVIKYLADKYPNRKINACGFSLGAGLLLKFLGEEGSDCLLSSAVAVSPSYDMTDGMRTPQFEKYEKLGMCQSLVDLVKRHEKFLKTHPDSKLDWDGMVNAKTIKQFDQAAIVGKKTGTGSPPGGEDFGSPQRLTGVVDDFLHFASVEDYYVASSSIHFSHLIQVPCLSISSVDDPVCSHRGVPTNIQQVGKGLVVLKTYHGGHVAFVDNPIGSHGIKYGYGSAWSDRMVSTWFKAANDSSL